MQRGTERQTGVDDSGPLRVTGDINGLGLSCKEGCGWITKWGEKPFWWRKQPEPLLTVMGLERASTSRKQCLDKCEGSRAFVHEGRTGTVGSDLIRARAGDVGIWMLSYWQ